MSKICIFCDRCGKPLFKYESQIKGKNFCSRQCASEYSNKVLNPDGYKYRSFEVNSKRMSHMNQELNPVRMTPSTRRKVREARLGSGKGKGYAKYYGKHEHRVAAEKMLGRPLRPGEIVHHIDGDKRNNNPENLIVFASQSDHVIWHRKWGRLIQSWIPEEVMPV
jgi:DNA-directed RNA polymerase subunit M/transcription elongation factor TFIIS